MTSTDIHAEILELTTDDGPMAVPLKQPAGDPPDGGWPTVVIFMDAPGIRSLLHDFMEKLVGAGYRVATPDLYHREGRMIGFEPADMSPENQARMWELLSSLTDEGIQHDLDVTLAALDLPAGSRIGCIGFCLGARAVYRSVERLPELFGAGAMWHPSFLTTEPNPPSDTAADLTVPLYIGIGTADKVQSIEMHQAFFDAIADVDHVDLQIYEGADHGFTFPGAATYHQEASDASWDKTMALFSANLT